MLAVCPGAPYGPPFTGIAHGNVPMAVGLMVILAGSSALLSPLLLTLLLPRVSAGQTVQIDPPGLIATLLLTQLLPLLTGLLIRHWRPPLAAGLLGPCGLASKILNLAVVVLILATQFQVLMKIRLLAFGGMLALLIASLVIGWFAGASDRASRKTMAVTTALRNAAVGLVIVTGNFPGTPAATAVLVYAIFALFGTLVVRCAWAGRRRRDKARAHSVPPRWIGTSHRPHNHAADQPIDGRSRSVNRYRAVPRSRNLCEERGAASFAADPCPPACPSSAACGCD